MATIKEVAQRAGVSIRTVSRVLNEHPHVANETRERVLRVIEELDFRPNAAARYMRTGQSQLIGFLTDEVAQNVFSYDLIIGAQQAALACPQSLYHSLSETPDGCGEWWDQYSLRSRRTIGE